MMFLGGICIFLISLVVAGLIKIASEPSPLCNGRCENCQVEKECEHSFMR